MPRIDRTPLTWWTGTIDLARPLVDLATGGAAWAHILVTYDGEPLGQTALEVPLDPFPGAWLARELADRFTVELARARFRPQRTSRPFPTEPSSTVVVCTRDRPDSLDRCLRSLDRLDPAPHGVIVVDNGSSEPGIRQIVADHGCNYVWEPDPGLDRARNRGLTRVASELVLYTDDDVEVDPRWLGALVGCFDDPLVMAATGLVAPAVMDTEARRRFERYAGFGRGYERKVVDGTQFSPYGAGAMGAGASMAFRSQYLRAAGGFPEELDAGMPTGSGGDTWALYDVLRRGYRIAFEPSAVAFHTHRATERELRSALRGYGNGLGSFLAASLIRHRDPAALFQGSRIIGGYLGAKVVRSAMLAPRAVPLPLALAEARGVIDTFTGFRRARRIVGSRAPVELGTAQIVHSGTVSASAPPPVRLKAGVELPTMSVVIPSRARRETLHRLLCALEAQRYPGGRLEVVVSLDGDLDHSAAMVSSLPSRHRREIVLLDAPGGDPSQGNGAAVVRNRGAEQASGDLMVFLDDDVEPLDDELLVRHATRHCGASPRAVVGPCHPVLTDADDLFALRIRNWWTDHTRRLSSSDPLSFADFGTGNVSMSTADFRRLGGFLPMPRREDWELGYRVMRAGIDIVGEPAAAVHHRADVDLPNALEDRYREGRGDAIFARTHPEALPWLSLAGWYDLTPGHKRLIRTMFVDPERRVAVRDLARRSLPMLERTGSRRRYGQLLAAAQLSSYWAGVGAELGGEDGWLGCLRASRRARGPAMSRCDLTDTDAWPSPEPGSVASVVITVGNDEIGRVPVGWGGVPWSRQQFLETVAQRLSSAASTATGRRRLIS